MSANKTNRGLGRGFDYLMPQGVDSVLYKQGENRIQKLFIKDIRPNPNQPRKEFKAELLEELASSIKLHGVLQPILVSDSSDSGYIIIAGERRWRASQIAGLDTIPALVRTMEDLEQLEVSIVENIQRVDLSPLEQAMSIHRLHEIFGLSYEAIARKLNKAESTVNNTARLIKLPDTAKQALSEGSISEGHARAILSLDKYPEFQETLLGSIIKNGWSVRQAEQFAVGIKKDSSAKKAGRNAQSTNPSTERLSKVFGRKVTVRNMAKGGRLVIEFTSDDDFDSLVDLLRGVNSKN